MSNPAQDMLDQGMRAHEEILGNPTIVYGGRHWPCLFSSLRRGLTVMVGGAEEEVKMSVSRRISARAPITADQTEGSTADSDTQPTADSGILPFQNGKLVLANNKRFRLANVNLDSSGAIETADLVSPDRMK